MRIVTAHQPAYLPWMGYFHKIALSDVFVLLDDVQFEKNSFTNRNYILSPVGKVLLTVPIQSKGHTGKTIREMKINNSEKWRMKHWKSIEQNYRKASCFKAYAPFFEAIYSREWESLVAITSEMLKFFMQELAISTEIILQSEMGCVSHKQELVLDICKKADARIYVSGKMGKDYLNVDNFTENRIQVYFQEYKCAEYGQMGNNDFEPNLGIVDMLFNQGKEKTKKLLFSNNITKNDLLKGRDC